MTAILRGNILHTPAFGALEAIPRGYLVLEDGVIQGVCLQRMIYFGWQTMRWM